MKELNNFEKKLRSNEVLKDLKKLLEDNNFCDSFFLTGGAVIDILEDREPKDFDIVSTSSLNNILTKSQEVPDLKLIYTSRTAITFLFKHKHIIQVLKKSTEDFKFTIEKSMYSIKKEKLIDFCYHSFLSKNLIPNDTPFEEGSVTKKNFKIRLEKWKSKGYKIHKKTEMSYLKWARSTSLVQIIKEYFRPKSESEYES